MFSVLRLIFHKFQVLNYSNWIAHIMNFHYKFSNFNQWTNEKLKERPFLSLIYMMLHIHIRSIFVVSSKAYGQILKKKKNLENYMDYLGLWGNNNNSRWLKPRHWLLSIFTKFCYIAYKMKIPAFSGENLTVLSGWQGKILKLRIK